MPEHNVRVIAPDVGGGFGSKLNMLPEDFIVPLMAIITGRPVKWIESRTENLQNTVHGRDMVDYIEIAAKRDGTITGPEGRASMPTWARTAASSPRGCPSSRG